MNFSTEDKATNSRPPKEIGCNQSTFLGIHLSGPNTPKTAVVILRQTVHGILSLEQVQVYEKIGPKGNLFSDDRLIRIIEGLSQVESIVVDQPLSVPPCVACERPRCPGVVHCDDIVVASMMKIAVHLQKVAPSKTRFMNPQTQRLWDMLQLEKKIMAKESPHEPTYQGHLAPLVTRALVLKKRLQTIAPEVPLFETSVKLLVEQAASQWRLSREEAREYRSFEKGFAVRQKIVRHILVGQDACVLDLTEAQSRVFQGNADKIAASVECFNALICAWLGVLRARGLVPPPPQAFPPNEGWVSLPEFIQSVL